MLPFYAIYLSGNRLIYKTSGFTIQDKKRFNVLNDTQNLIYLNISDSLGHSSSTECIPRLLKATIDVLFYTVENFLTSLSSIKYLKQFYLLQWFCGFNFLCFKVKSPLGLKPIIVKHRVFHFFLANRKPFLLSFSFSLYE